MLEKALGRARCRFHSEKISLEKRCPMKNGRKWGEAKNGSFKSGVGDGLRLSDEIRRSRIRIPPPRWKELRNVGTLKWMGFPFPYPKLRHSTQSLASFLARDCEI